MRISVVCLASRLGGGLTILKDLYQYAVDEDTSNDWQFVLSDQELGHGTSRVRLVHAAPQYKGWLSRLKAELTVARRAIDDFDPDVVLSLQNIDTPARGGRPLAIYMHQSLPYAERRFSVLNATERKLAIRQRILGTLINKSVDRAHVTLVQTKWIEDALRMEAPGARIKRIGYRLPTNHAPDTRRQDTSTFLYPASAAIYKDHATLHRAVRLLHGRGVDIGQIVLTLTRGAFESIVGEISHQEAAWYKFIGHVDKRTLSQWYLQSILVFPSHIETLGLPLYEAKAYHCPIVAADIAPTREALEGYVNYQLHQPASPESLADAMERAWNERNNGSEQPFQVCLDGIIPSESPWRVMVQEFHDASNRG